MMQKMVYWSKECFALSESFFFSFIRIYEFETLSNRSLFL